MGGFNNPLGRIIKSTKERKAIGKTSLRFFRGVMNLGFLQEREDSFVFTDYV